MEDIVKSIKYVVEASDGRMVEIGNLRKAKSLAREMTQGTDCLACVVSADDYDNYRGDRRIAAYRAGKAVND